MKYKNTSIFTLECAKPVYKERFLYHTCTNLVHYHETYNDNGWHCQPITLKHQSDIIVPYAL